MSFFYQLKYSLALKYLFNLIIYSKGPKFSSPKSFNLLSAPFITIQVNCQPILKIKILLFISITFILIMPSNAIKMSVKSDLDALRLGIYPPLYIPPLRGIVHIVAYELAKEA